MRYRRCWPFIGGFGERYISRGLERLLLDGNQILLVFKCKFIISRLDKRRERTLQRTGGQAVIAVIVEYKPVVSLSNERVKPKWTELMIK